MNTTESPFKKNVYLVDDHPLVREWLSSLINQTSDLAVCGEAESAAKALSDIIKLKPSVAVIDISLKDSPGIELIKDLKEACPQVAVLVLSMHEESQYAERALRAGAKGYIMKRETTRKVLDGIRQVMEGKLFVSENVTAAITTQFIQGRAPSDISPIAQLSDRELEVFEMLGNGQGTREIAQLLHVSIKTVQAYCARIKEKLNVNNATELLREAFRWHDRQKDV